MPHTLGLDLSLTQTGAAVHGETPGTYTTGICRTSPDHGTLGLRLAMIADFIDSCIQHRDVQVAVVEQPYNAAHGIEPAKVFGVAIYTLFQAGVPVAVVPPQSLKVFACGSGQTGGAAKIGPAVEAAKRLGYDGHNDNEVDALWLAVLGWHLLDRPVVDLPQTHTRALTGKWAKNWPGYTPPAAKPRARKANKKNEQQAVTA